MLRYQSYRKLFAIYSLLFFTALNVNHHGQPSSSSFSQKWGSYNNVFPAMNKLLSNEQVNRFVKDYVQKNNEWLYRIKQRSNAHFIMIDSVFNNCGLPVALKYLAVVESELKSTAVSNKGAAGPWQLMPGTAQILGLRITQTTDERTRFYKSTKAAARYLKDLHAEFGDWLLVLAAYNGGPGPVDHAIRVAGSNNYWNLQYYLPDESREHVNKFIATKYYFEKHRAASTIKKEG
jgi:membrane-bound lytic murein transglycosylase D